MNFKFKEEEKVEQFFTLLALFEILNFGSAVLLVILYGIYHIVYGICSLFYFIYICCMDFIRESKDEENESEHEEVEEDNNPPPEGDKLPIPEPYKEAA